MAVIIIIVILVILLNSLGIIILSKYLNLTHWGSDRFIYTPTTDPVQEHIAEAEESDPIDILNQIVEQGLKDGNNCSDIEKLAQKFRILRLHNPAIISREVLENKLSLEIPSKIEQLRRLAQLASCHQLVARRHFYLGAVQKK